MTIGLTKQELIRVMIEAAEHLGGGFLQVSGGRDKLVGLMHDESGCRFVLHTEPPVYFDGLEAENFADAEAVRAVIAGQLFRNEDGKHHALGLLLSDSIKRNGENGLNQVFRELKNDTFVFDEEQSYDYIADVREYVKTGTLPDINLCVHSLLYCAMDGNDALYERLSDQLAENLPEDFSDDMDATEAVCCTFYDHHDVSWAFKDGKLTSIGLFSDRHDCGFEITPHDDIQEVFRAALKTADENGVFQLYKQQFTANSPKLG